MSEFVKMAPLVARHLRALSRNMEAVGDNARIATDALICDLGRQWEYPELVLSDEDRDYLEARQLRRILADIDDLPAI